MLSRLLFLSLAISFFLTTPVRASQEEEVLGKKSSEWLKILKEHKESKFRRAAVIALTVMGPRTAGVLPALLEGLENDADPEIRREIAQSLGLFGADAKGTVDTLAGRLATDKSAKVREAAARSLGKLADYAPIHVMALGRALKDASPETRAVAAEALQNFGDKAKLVLPQLLEAAQDKKSDRFTRLYAVQILAKQAGDDGKIATALAGILQDKETPLSLRQAVAAGLGSMGPAAVGAVAPLAETAEDAKQDIDLRRAAAVALSRIGEKAASAWPTIARLLKDSDTGIRLQAVRLAGILGKGTHQAAKELVTLLPKERNAEVLLAAIQELGELGTQEATGELRRLANLDSRQSIREAAGAALKKIQGMP